MSAKIHIPEAKVYTAIGLMSGTSMDGIDAALIETDGESFVRPIGFLSQSYDAPFRAVLKSCLGSTKASEKTQAIERELTLRHAQIIGDLLAQEKRSPETIDAIGFHGHTLHHDPDNGVTWQIGDGQLLAHETEITVVNDFRTADVKAGGQGAPLLPLYHRIMVQNNDKLKTKQAVSILNLGGVGNISHIDIESNRLCAFDTGPANALLDDFIAQRTHMICDMNGDISTQGSSNSDIVDALISHPYFTLPAPKSLDRDMWRSDCVEALSLEDGAATLCEFTARSALIALDHLPTIPAAIYVCGGGRHNSHMMNRLNALSPCPVHAIEALGHNGDAIEAEGFGLFAVRHILGLPTSLPEITGAQQPIIGGAMHSVPNAQELPKSA